jgi:hypothetical protein
MTAPRPGLRHAAALLLRNRVRSIAPDASPRAIVDGLERLAHDLVGLARDMRADGESALWLTDEYVRAVDRLPVAFERDQVVARATGIIGQIASFRYAADRRDLFLIHVPEDRVAVAAPLAIELAKRRLTVALAEYEVTTAEELEHAVERGLTDHAAGIVLSTGAYKRRQLPDLAPEPRLQILSCSHDSYSIDDLVLWASQTLPR